MKALKFILTGLAGIICICSFAQNGDELFRNNCAVCHTVGNGILVGPDLKGIDKKYSEAHLLKWVKSSQSVIKSGDTAAKAIYKQFNNITMPDQLLSDIEIKSIIVYIKTESIDQVALTDTASGKIARALINNRTSAKESNSEDAKKSGTLINPDTFFSYLGLGGIAAFFLIILWVLASALKNLSEGLTSNNKQNE
jgi:cytochrome c551/c552